MVTRTSSRPVPRPSHPTTRAVSRPSAPAAPKKTTSSTRSSFSAKATPGTALGRAAPKPNTRLTAGLSPSEAKAKLAQEKAPAKGQSLTSAARRRTALENDARAKPAKTTVSTEASSGLTGAELTRTATLQPSAKGNKRSAEAGVSFNSKEGTVSAELTASHKAKSLGHKRVAGTMDNEAIARDRGRDAVDRVASLEVTSGKVERSGTLLARTAGDDKTGASLKVGEAKASAAGAVRVGVGTVRADGKAGAELNLVRAEAKVTTRVGGRELELKAEGRIGAQANANGSVVFDPRRGEVRVGASADVFAGARAGVSGSYEILPGIRLGGEAEGRAGIGAGASLDAGLRRGTFKFKGSLSATLGIGGKLGGNVEINPAETLAAVRKRSPALDVAIKTGQQLATSAAVRQTAATVQRAGTQAVVSTGRQLVKTAATATTTVVRTAKFTAQALDSGRQLAARTQAAFRTFVSTPSAPRRLVTSAMARVFTGGF